MISERKTGIKNNIRNNAKGSNDRIAATNEMKVLWRKRRTFNTKIRNAVTLEKACIENKIANTKSSFFRSLMVLERIKDGFSSGSCKKS